MTRKKSLLFQLIICLFIAAMVLLTAVLNAYSFKNSSIDSAAENRAVILSQIKGTLEYGLKYGRKLDNYYGIEETLEKVTESCQADYVYIRDAEGKLLYGEDPKDDFSHNSEDESNIWTENNMSHVILPIKEADDIGGYIGMGCSTESMQSFSTPYVRQIYAYAFFEVIGGIILFLILFNLVRHNFEEKKLRLLITGTIIVLSALSVIPNHYILRVSYTALAEGAASDLLSQSSKDIERLLEAGVYYSDISDTESYYSELADACEQVSEIKLTEEENTEGIALDLPSDGEGKTMHLKAAISQNYVSKKVRTALINSLVTSITAIMISIEILLFLLGLLIGREKERIKRSENPRALTIERFGVVRGLSFFFASFRFMAVAFMSTVLIQIYTPVYIWGHPIPYEIVLSLPMAGQVFVAMITSYISGIVIHKIGWKYTTLMGIALMMVGTFASSFATVPVPFIFAQMIVGTGLGFAKMGVDIYAVTVSSEEDMSKYTSGSNAGIIVGFSCSAALGALVASIFGYQGAYVAMTVIGALVFLIVLFFGMNVASRVEKEETADKTQIIPGGPDIRFPSYIVLVIIPYYFIMMFVDYYFPVYAKSVGITTDAIGYVMLIYGIVTAYVGTPLCPVFTKRAKSKTLIPFILLLLALGMFIFAARNNVIMAAILVALIGLVDGIMPSAQFMYVYDLPFAKRIGFSKALGIEGFFSNMIGAVAPIIFGFVMMYGNGGLAAVAILTALSAVLFMFINGVFRQKKDVVSSILILALVTSLFTGMTADAAVHEKIRIGYCQAGSYYEFDYQIYQIGMALIENGELSSDALEKLKQGDDAKTVWKALCEGSSPYYEFVENGYIDVAKAEQADVEDIIREQKIDLMIAMGTTAALEIKNNTNVPYLNFTASDPVSSGITGGVDFSGDSRAWAHVDAGLEMRALSVMGDIFAPKKIGIVYSNEDPEAYTYSGARSLDEFAAANDQEVVREFVSDEFEETDEEYQKYKNNLLNAHKKLAESGIDVFVLTTSYLLPADFEEVLSPLVEKGIPVFSINSTEDVRFGALAAVEMIDYQNVGRFAADTLSKYQKGSDLKELPQQYATAPFLVLNIDTMRKTNVTLPLDTMISASKIYGQYEGQ